MRLIDATKLEREWEELKAKDLYNGGGYLYSPSDVLDSIEEAETIDPDTLAPRWRNAKTDPPKEDGEYLVYMSSGRYMLLRWNNKGHIWTGNGLNYTKQKTEWWAELPQLPKRECENDA